MESDLEKALITHMEKFLLELGKGFMYVGSQQRVTLGNTHYYVDMVFYNKILRSYVLIELKTGKLMPEASIKGIQGKIKVKITKRFTKRA